MKEISPDQSLFTKLFQAKLFFFWLTPYTFRLSPEALRLMPILKVLNKSSTNPII